MIDHIFFRVPVANDTMMTAAIPIATPQVPPLVLAPRQLIDDRLTHGVLEHRPAADLVDRALAAEAEAALAIDRADGDITRLSGGGPSDMA
jgi:hypothetical protein